MPRLEVVVKILNRFSGVVVLEVKGNLRSADLSGANLSDADLSDEDLSDADLHHANLRSADLRGANLSGANLRSANLSDADLRSADLHHADLHHADLSCANLDFSAFPLWCGCFGAKVDMKIIAQLCYHICRLENTTKEYGEIRSFLKKYANRFHRVEECGKIK